MSELTKESADYRAGYAAGSDEVRRLRTFANAVAWALAQNDALDFRDFVATAHAQLKEGRR